MRKWRQRLERYIYIPRNIKDCQQPSVAKGEAWNNFLPQKSQNEPTLPKPPFWISDFQDCKRINCYCFKSLMLWYFVMADPENLYMDSLTKQYY